MRFPGVTADGPIFGEVNRVPGGSLTHAIWLCTLQLKHNNWGIPYSKPHQALEALFFSLFSYY